MSLDFQGNTITVPWGSSETLDGTVTNAGGSIAAWSLYFTAKRNVNDADADAVISLSLGSGIAIVDGAAGTYRVTLTPTDYADAVAGEKLRAEVVALVGTTRHYLWQGTLLLQSVVRRAVP